MDLPSELRVMIYRCLFMINVVENDDVHLVSNQSQQSVVQPPDSPWIMSPAILRTSSEICAEAIDILYARGFSFPDADAASRFFGVISKPAANRVKHVVFNTIHLSSRIHSLDRALFADFTSFENLRSIEIRDLDMGARGSERGRFERFFHIIKPFFVHGGRPLDLAFPFGTWWIEPREDEYVALGTYITRKLGLAVHPDSSLNNEVIAGQQGLGGVRLSNNAEWFEHE